MTIHLINAFRESSGGSERATLALYDELTARGGDVRLWAQSAPHPEYARRYPIIPIDYRRLRFPKTGTFVLIGVYWNLGRWIALTMPSRIIVKFNTPSPMHLQQRLNQLGRLARNPGVELIYPSSFMQDLAGMHGTIEPSLIDLTRFAPAAHRNGATFRVGRLSRDTRSKFHEDDAEFYARLLAAGCEVSLMGSTCLAGELAPHPSLEMRPACAIDAAAFLRSLDCFYYRTSDRWTEPHGRVITEAMACGLPVVCHREGGYTDFIRHGENGFLFVHADEAFGYIDRLRRDPELRKRIGAAARATMERMMGPAARARVAGYYLVGLGAMERRLRLAR